MDNQTEGSGPSELEVLKGRARLIGVEFSNNIGVDTLRERVNARLAELDTFEPEQQQTKPSDVSIEDVVDTGPIGNFDDDIPEDDEVTLEPEVNGFTAAQRISQFKYQQPQVINPIAPLKVKNTPDLSSGGAMGASSLAPKPGRKLSLRQHLYNEQMRLIRVRIQCLDPKKADLPGEILTIANKHLGTVKRFIPYGEVSDDGWHIPYIMYKELERRKFLSIRTVKDPRTKQLVMKKGWAKEFSIEVLPPLTEGEIRQLAAAQAAAGSIDTNNTDLL